MASKKTGEDRTPSADEIIEALSLEMGVTGEDADAKAKAEPAAAAPAAASEPDAKKAEEKKAEKKPAKDPMAAMGGIFDVPSAKKDEKKAEKKAEKPAEKKAAPPDEARAEEKKPAEKKAAPDGGGEAKVEKKAEKPAEKKAEKPAEKKAAPIAGLDDIFNVSGEEKAEVDDGPAARRRSREPEEDDDRELAKLEAKASGGTNRILIVVIVMLVLGFGAFIVFQGGYGGDILAVFSGTYRDKKDQEKRRIEEDFRKEQIAKLEKYGNLNITGTDHALFKVQLEGYNEPRPLYGRIGETNVYRPLRLPVILQGLKIKKPINIIIEAPSYRPKPMTLTENMWTGDPLGDYVYQTSVYLDYESSAANIELQDRMLTFDEEKEGIPAGTIRVESTPPGAKVMINKRLVVDKDGNPMLTPVTITEVPPDPEKKDDKKKPEPKPLEINTPPDNGYRIDVAFDDPNMPQFVDVVQRSLWICNPKSEDELKKLPKDARPALKCNYTATVSVDFNAIKAEILRVQAEEEERRKQAEERARLEEEAAGGKKKDEPKPE